MGGIKGKEGACNEEEFVPFCLWPSSVFEEKTDGDNNLTAAEKSCVKIVLVDSCKAKEFPSLCGSHLGHGYQDEQLKTSYWYQKQLF